jgi:hypothetical protein
VLRRAWFTSLLVLLFLAFVVGLAWLHSHVIGFRQTWAGADQRSCGRLVSSRGQLFLQSFSASVTALKSGDSAPEQHPRLPPDFVVGSHP